MADMKQVWIIAQKEFRSALRDKIFIVITLLFLILSIVSVYIGSSTKNAELKAYSNIVDLLKSQGSKAFPPEPQIYALAILSNIIKYVSIVGAVLAIFLGFDTFSGEKENGTMKLILSRPIYRDQLISGKLLGGALVIGLLLIVTLFFNTLLFSFVSGLSPGLSEISRLITFMLFAFCYMMSFYIATVFVSIKTNDRSFGFLVMLILWIGVSFVIPQLAESQKSFAYALNSTAQTVTQVPSDTIVSKTIEIFSPTVHFQRIGGDLLQTASETANSSVGDILMKRSLIILYMLAPGILLLFGSYRTFVKEVE
jgi:ABC-2 type transport system permease protein